MRDNECILRSPKRMKNFCKRHERDFGCKEAGMCRIGFCPVMTLKEIDFLTSIKNVADHEAYKMCMREKIPENIQKLIIHGLFKPKTEYPKGSREEAIENEERDSKDQSRQPRGDAPEDRGHHQNDKRNKKTNPRKLFEVRGVVQGDKG